MADSQKPDDAFVPVVDIEIDSVQPGASGFVLLGRAADRSDYRLEMHLDFPVDRRTQTVMGELLAQSEWRVLRRAPSPLKKTPARRTRKPVA
jgi:hypothetical protein